LFDHVQGILVQHFARVLSSRTDYLYALGTNPIALVAHLDTLADYRTEFRFLEADGWIANANGILGADDRAGVYAILTILEECTGRDVDKPSVIFANHEETGCLGVKRFIRDEVLSTGVKLFIELDRCGSDEYVAYMPNLPKAVAAYIEHFGYRRTQGTSSDIKHLTRAYGIPSVNVSVGYYRQHTMHERLNIRELFATIERVLAMLRTPIKKLYRAQAQNAGHGFYQDRRAAIPPGINPSWTI
jgi:di/tripeptidase